PCGLRLARCVRPEFTCAAATEVYTLSLHDALPIWRRGAHRGGRGPAAALRCGQGLDQHGRGGTPPGHRRDHPPVRLPGADPVPRSEEHTSELQSRENLVCRLLLEKKNAIKYDSTAV